MKNEDFFYISVHIYEQGIYKWFFEEKSVKKASQVRFITRSSVPFCSHGCYNVKYQEPIKFDGLLKICSNVFAKCNINLKCYNFWRKMYSD